MCVTVHLRSRLNHAEEGFILLPFIRTIQVIMDTTYEPEAFTVMIKTKNEPLIVRVHLLVASWIVRLSKLQLSYNPDRKLVNAHCSRLNYYFEVRKIDIK